MKKRFKGASAAVWLGIGVFAYLKHPKFGRKPTGKRLGKIKQSQNYRNGKFQNQSETPAFSEGATYFTVLKKFIFEKDKRSRPKQELPSQKTDLHSLNPEENILVWFGHSSYFMQLDGKKILVDPVFSGSASPLPNGTKAFKGTDRYTAEDIPDLDYLFITHDHWDHLDFQTITNLKPKINKVITGLGTGEHFEYWGFNPEIIFEMDWDEEISLETKFNIHSVPARHFSGRDFKRNMVLWTSFIFKTPNFKIFIGGDSGYDTHFIEIGEKFGPFDLAILENGQYNRHWKYIHMHPEESLRAAKNLKAKTLLPVHHSKFALSTHAWYKPLKEISRLHDKDENLKLLTPMIGEKLNLEDENQLFSKWWQKGKF